jgi:alpha,alpha-trehalase
MRYCRLRSALNCLCKSPSATMRASKASAAVLFAVLPLASGLYENGSVIAPCDSPIYCYGDILREIELARPFADSKTFVDL